MKRTPRDLRLMLRSLFRYRKVQSLFVIIALAAATAGPSARAHGPTPHKIDETVVIAAKPEKVWALIGEFADLAKWHPLVSASAAKSDEIQGKLRVVTLKSGGTIVDGLTEYDPAKMTYSYRRVDDDVKALPVSSYTATISVVPAPDGAVVEWIGRYYRGDTGNDPPENLNDEAAAKAMEELFQSGLSNLKALAERQG